MRKRIVALLSLLGIALFLVSEAQAISARGIARRSRSRGSNISGFPINRAGLSNQTIRAPRPGWYFPELGPVEHAPNRSATNR